MNLKIIEVQNEDGENFEDIIEKETTPKEIQDGQTLFDAKKGYVMSHGNSIK
eukprot:CAMPEP_0170550630 /NCGR_PEP_ID=MMETSP0211-20121228/8659_1 /TAXON_ID=311385 /ORGANISM="Pseudokeronopsis sp., Strain OXSARD2" /LENGTH=51 /DNA_ID=CAMNT_0010857269 /DNA_START=88 /DNA_END=243 /DNA_ORIENTATION=-